MAIILSAVFTAISLLLLIVGAVLTLVLSGQTHHRSGPQVGAEIMSGQSSESEDSRGGSFQAQRSFFVGRAASLERQASIDFGTLKRQLAAGNCLALIPWLLAIGGFVGVLFFGALLFLALSPNVIGVAVLLVVLYALLRMGIAFLRA